MSREGMRSMYQMITMGEGVSNGVLHGGGNKGASCTREKSDKDEQEQALIRNDHWMPKVWWSLSRRSKEWHG